MKITFETYPNMFVDEDCAEENLEYDREIRVFDVDKSWAIDWVFIHYRMGLDDFINEYTWDDTFQMYEDAKISGTLISETIEER